ncbi:MAG: DUF1540 domain-containing protein [Firmicutes bacterium]|nr:DUF1540 domain-containing protein [Bacillota bacterium]
MTEVRCKVNSCVFWGKGDYCTAAEIWVKNSLVAGDEEELYYQADFEFAGELEEEESVSSGQTYCETMQPR